MISGEKRRKLRATSNGDDLWWWWWWVQVCVSVYVYWLVGCLKIVQLIAIDWYCRCSNVYVVGSVRVNIMNFVMKPMWVMTLTMMIANRVRSPNWMMDGSMTTTMKTTIVGWASSWKASNPNGCRECQRQARNRWLSSQVWPRSMDGTESPPTWYENWHYERGTCESGPDIRVIVCVETIIDPARFAHHSRMECHHKPCRTIGHQVTIR